MMSLELLGCGRDDVVAIPRAVESLRTRDRNCHKYNWARYHQSEIAREIAGGFLGTVKL